MINNKQLFKYIFIGLFCVPAINAMDKTMLVQHVLENLGFPKETRYEIGERFSESEIKKAQEFLKRMDLPLMEQSKHNEILSLICCLDEKGNKGLRLLLRPYTGKYLPSELSFDELEQIKSIPSDLLRHVSPYPTVEDFSKDFDEVPRDILHQEERKNGLLRIVAAPILGGCMGGVCAFSALGSSLLEGKGVISKNDAICAIALLGACAQVWAVVDYAEMEYRYNFSSEKIPSVYRKKKIMDPFKKLRSDGIDPFKKWRSTGTDFKNYVNSPERQRSVALTE